MKYHLLCSLLISCLTSDACGSNARLFFVISVLSHALVVVASTLPSKDWVVLYKDRFLEILDIYSQKYFQFKNYSFLLHCLEQTIIKSITYLSQIFTTCSPNRTHLQVYVIDFHLFTSDSHFYHKF